MKEIATNSKVSMPYNTDIQIAEAIMDTLAREHEIEVGELFKKIVAKNRPIKSYSLSLCKFLGFVETQGTKLKLTKLGYKYVNTNKKKELISQNLPDKYKTILAWIKNNKGTMTLDEIKNAIIDNWGTPPKERVFNSMLRTFGNFCNHVGIIKYVKGNAGRIELTQLGFSALSPKRQSEENDKTQKIEGKQEQIPADDFICNNDNNIKELEGNYPIRIMTKGTKPFDWDVYSEEDWKVVEAALEAIKRRWKDKNNIQLGLKAEISNTKHDSSNVSG